MNYIQPLQYRKLIQYNNIIILNYYLGNIYIKSSEHGISEKHKS
jgi:hypothetical protein